PSRRRGRPAASHPLQAASTKLSGFDPYLDNACPASLSGRTTPGLLAQHSDEPLDLSTITLDYSSEFRALRHGHADTVHGDVSNVVGAAWIGQVPAVLTGGGARWVDACSRDIVSVRFRPSSGHL